MTSIPKNITVGELLRGERNNVTIRYYRIGALTEGHPLFGEEGINTVAEAFSRCNKERSEARKPFESFADDLDAVSLYSDTTGKWVGVSWSYVGCGKPSFEVDKCFRKPNSWGGSRALRAKCPNKEVKETYVGLKERIAAAQKAYDESKWNQRGLDEWELVGVKRRDLFGTRSQFFITEDGECFASIPCEPRGVEFEEILASEYHKAHSTVA